MHLKSTQKHTTLQGYKIARVKPSKETLQDIKLASSKIGITRLSDITSLDKLHMPNYSAVLPGTSDSIWVYGGKGLTRTDAKVSALMEAIERHSSLGNTYSGTIIQGSYTQLSKTHEYVLRPDEVVESTVSFDDYAILDYLVGYDLVSCQNVLVPAEIALHKYIPTKPAAYAFSHSHTNGLASGNTIEEAISHALCEVIERDALSIADLCSSSIGYNILCKIENEISLSAPFRNIPLTIGDKFVDDPSIFPDVDITETDSEAVRIILRRFNDAGLSILVKDVTQYDIGVTTFAASSMEWITHDYGYFARGCGTHPDSETALIRALTEVSQTRAANVQGARDDLRKIRYDDRDKITDRKWQFMRSTVSSAKGRPKSDVRFDKIKSCRNQDILDDINYILNQLKKVGLRSIVVDLTNPSIGIPVVRVIVPGLETFQVTSSVMGERAKEYFRKLHS